MKKLITILLITLLLMSCSSVQFRKVIARGKSQLERIVLNKEDPKLDYIISRGQKMISTNIDNETGQRIFNIIFDAVEKEYDNLQN